MTTKRAKAAREEELRKRDPSELAAMLVALEQSNERLRAEKAVMKAELRRLKPDAWGKKT